MLGKSALSSALKEWLYEEEFLLCPECSVPCSPKPGASVLSPVCATKLPVVAEPCLPSIHSSVMVFPVAYWQALVPIFLMGQSGPLRA